MAKLAAGSKRKSHPPKAVAGYKTLGGHNPETSALRNLLAAQGIVRPDGEKYSEALLLGIGGGLGFGYFAFEMKSGNHLVLGTRHRWEDMSAGFLEGIGQRLKLDLDIKETTSDRGASNFLVNTVRTQGRAAICWVDLASLPWHFLPPELKKYVVHSVAVFGLDEDAAVALVDDRAQGPFLVGVEELGEARAAISGLKNRILSVNEVVSKPDVKAAILEGIALTIESNRNPSIKNFGLAGIEKWADLVANPKDKKGWPTLFKPGPALVEAAVAAYNWLELMSGGGALRPLYAQFLDEAAVLAKKPKLTKVAEEYRKLAVLWSDFAQALLPEEVSRFKYVREALNKKHKAISMGAASMSDAEKATKEVASTKKTASDKPFTEAEAKAYYAGLRERLKALHEGETKALAALASAVK
jgi:hypothetical protein